MKIFRKRKDSEPHRKGGKNGRQSTEPLSDHKPMGAVKPSDITESRRKASRGFFSGDVLYRESVRRHYPFALYCCLLILLYMGYIFNCQRTQRQEITCRITLQRERSKALLLSSERLEASRHNNIIEEIERRGIDIRQWNEIPIIIRNETEQRER